MSECEHSKLTKLINLREKNLFNFSMLTIESSSIESKLHDFCKGKLYYKNKKTDFIKNNYLITYLNTQT